MTEAQALSPEEELAKLRKSREARDAAAEADDQALELEELRLDEQLSAAGKRGKDYEIVATDYGVFGVKTPDTKGIDAWDRLTKKDSSELTGDKVVAILRHYIVPPERVNDFHRVATERPMIANRVGLAFVSLMGAKHIESKKKF